MQSIVPMERIERSLGTPGRHEGRGRLGPVAGIGASETPGSTHSSRVDSRSRTRRWSCDRRVRGERWRRRDDSGVLRPYIHPISVYTSGRRPPPPRRLGRPHGTPVLADDAVYYAADETLDALGVTDGAVSWQVETGAMNAGSMVVEGTVIAPGTDARDFGVTASIPARRRDAPPRTRRPWLLIRTAEPSAASEVGKPSPKRRVGRLGGIVYTVHHLNAPIRLNEGLYI